MGDRTGYPRRAFAAEGDWRGGGEVGRGSKDTTDIYTATLEDNTQAEEQAAFKNYSRVTADVYDHTDAGTTYDKAQLLNGGNNSQVGLAKSIAVMPGDVVSAEVYAKYFEDTGGSGNLSGFAAALLSAFGLPTPAGGEAGTAAAAIQDYGAFIAGGGNPGTSGWPQDVEDFIEDFDFRSLQDSNAEGYQYELQIAISKVLVVDAANTKVLYLKSIDWTNELWGPKPVSRPPGTAWSDINKPESRS